MAVQGIGGLGHLGIQYARQMGFRTVAIGRGGDDKEALAKKLGAHNYIDTELTNGGGRSVAVPGRRDESFLPLRPIRKRSRHWLMAWGRTESWSSLAPALNLSPSLRCNSSLPAGLRGWPSGTAKDSEDTLQFSSLTGVRPMIERYPLEKVAEAYDQMISGRARFRVVLTMGK